MARGRAARFTLVLMLAAPPLCAQVPSTPPLLHLRVDAEHLFPAQPRTLAAHHETEATKVPVIHLTPLLDHLPPQLVQEVRRTEKRLTFQFDNYEVKPRVRLHEIGIVITRKLPS